MEESFSPEGMLDSYLYECQSEVVFEYRVDRRNYRLHRIIEKMGDAYGKKY